MDLSREIEVFDIEENEDGTVTIKFDMSQDLLNLFAGIGINKVLIDAANEKLGEQSKTEDTVETLQAKIRDLQKSASEWKSIGAMEMREKAASLMEEKYMSVDITSIISGDEEQGMRLAYKDAAHHIRLLELPQDCVEATNSNFDEHKFREEMFKDFQNT
jgi:hypothetical protein